MPTKPKNETIRRVVIFEGDASKFNATLKEMQASGAAAAKSLKNIDAQVKEVNGSLKSFQGQMQSASNILRGFGAIFVATEIVRYIAYLKDLAVGVAKTADSFRLIEVRLNRLGEGGDNFGALIDLSDKLGTGFKDTADQLALLAPAFDKLQIPFGKVVDFSYDMVQSLRLFGTDAVRAKIITVQLAQALGSGQFSGDELRSLNENAGALGLAFERAVQEILQTTASTKELGSQGKLTSAVVLQAFEKAFGPLREEYKNLPKLTEQAMERSANAWDVLTAAIDENYGITQKVTATYEYFTKVFYDLANSVADFSFDTLSKQSSDQLQRVIDNLDSQLNIFKTALDVAKTDVETSKGMLNKNVLRGALVQVQRIENEITETYEARARAATIIAQRAEDAAKSAASSPGVVPIDDKAYEEVDKQLRDFLENTQKDLRRVNSQIQTARDNVSKGVGGANEILQKLLVIQNDLLVSEKNLVLAYQQRGFNVDQLKDNISELNDEMNAQENTQREANRAIKDNIDLLKEQLSTVKKNITETDRLMEETLSTTGESYQGAELEKMQAIYSELASKMNEYVAEEKKLEAELAKLGETTSKTSEELGKFDKELQKIKENQEARKAFEGLISSLDAVTAAEIEQRDATATLVKAQTDLNLSSSQVASWHALIAQRFQESKDAILATAASMEGLTIRMKDSAFNSFSSWIDSAVQGTFDLKEAVTGLIKELVALAVKTAIFKGLTGAGFNVNGLFGLTAANGGYGQLALPQGVYTSPTLFQVPSNYKRFASGGVFAEAGPEAIMPLTRTSNGKLGVTAEAAAPVVNVYNQAVSDGYQATTATNSKGEIDVVISRIVQDVSRGGNNLARAFEGAYKLQRTR